MMRTLDRYIAREFLRLFVMFSMAAPMLFIIGDWTDNVGRYADRGLTGGDLLLGYLYQMPLFISWSLPIAGLIATVFTVSNMARHSELAAAKAGGISFFRGLIMLPIIGVAFTLVGLVLSEVVPVTTRMKAEVMLEKPAQQPTRSSFVYYSDDGSVFSLRRLDPETSSIMGLVMEREGDPPARAHMHLTGAVATYDAATGWTIENGYMRLYAGEQNESTWQFASARVRGFDETPEQLLAIPRDPEEMRYAELGAFIDALRRSGGKPLELMVEQAQKVAIPCATLIIILFGMPLANAASRSSPAYGIGIALGITIFYMLFFRVAGAAGASGALNPVLAAWMPNLVFAAAAVVLWGRVRT
jgi:lipopolysaccharide export system permease protein